MNQPIDQFFFCRLLSEFHKYCRRMAVQYRHPHALAGNHWAVRRFDHSVLNMAPDFHGLHLALLFFPADVGNYILHHLRPVLKGFSRTGDCLIGSGCHLIGLKLFPGAQGRRVGLDRTVGLYGNKAPGGAQTLFLVLNHLKMLRIDLWNHHGYVRGPAVGAVVGNHRGFRLRVLLLNFPDLLLGHIHSGKYKVNRRGHMLHIIHIHNHHIFNFFRHGRFHLPASAHRLLIGFPRASGAGCQGGYLKPGMIFQQ